LVGYNSLCWFALVLPFQFSWIVVSIRERRSPFTAISNPCLLYCPAHLGAFAISVFFPDPRRGQRFENVFPHDLAFFSPIQKRTFINPAPTSFSPAGVGLRRFTSLVNRPAAAGSLAGKSPSRFSCLVLPSLFFLSTHLFSIFFTTPPEGHS